MKNIKKQQNVIIGILTVVIGFGVLVWLAQPSGEEINEPMSANVSSSLSSGALAASERAFDFGSISMAAGKVSKTFTVKNGGDGPLAINKVYTSCMCTEATLKVGDRQKGPYGMPGHGFVPKINETISPGEEATVEIVFDPAAHGPAGVGRIERVVYVEHSAGDLLEFQISAMVTP